VENVGFITLKLNDIIAQFELDQADGAVVAQTYLVVLTHLNTELTLITLEHRYHMLRANLQGSYRVADRVPIASVTLVGCWAGLSQAEVLHLKVAFHVVKVLSVSLLFADDFSFRRLGLLDGRRFLKVLGDLGVYLEVFVIRAAPQAHDTPAREEDDAYHEPADKLSHV